jgi:hypothetical protein
MFHMCSLLTSCYVSAHFPDIYFMRALVGHFVYAALLVCIRCARIIYSLPTVVVVLNATFKLAFLIN